MKKMIAVVLSCFLIVFCLGALATDGEILFQNIPWLTDEAITKQILTESGFLREGQNIPTVPLEAGIYIKPGQEISYRPETDNQFQDICFSMSIRNAIGKMIAGYHVKDVIFTYVFDGFESKLISTKVILFGAEFSELKVKLTKVYGEGKDSATDDGYESIVWEGDNNSAVLLYTSSEGSTYQLIYGRLDAEKILNECMEKITAAPDMNDISGL